MAGKTIKIGRDAKNGQFIPVKEAEKRPSTTIVQKNQAVMYHSGGRSMRSSQSSDAVIFS